MSVDQVLDEFPQIEDADVRAALAFAACRAAGGRADGLFTDADPAQR